MGSAKLVLHSFLARRLLPVIPSVVLEDGLVPAIAECLGVLSVILNASVKLNLTDVNLACSVSTVAVEAPNSRNGINTDSSSIVD